MSSKHGSTKVETAKRIRYVQECLLEDIPSSDIQKAIVEKWSVTERQARRYIWAANKFFVEKYEKKAAEKKAYYIQRKKKLLREMDPKERKTARGVMAANKVIDSMAKIDGVLVENTVHEFKNPVEVKATFESKIDYSTLPTELLEAIVAQRQVMKPA